MRFGVNALSVVPRETGGGETYLRALLGALESVAAQAGHEVEVWCSENNASLFREAGAVRLRTLPFDNRRRAARLSFEHLRLGPLAAAAGCDALYGPGNALPLRLGLPSVLGVQSLHSFLVPEEMSRLRVAYFRRMLPRSARRADRVLCVSEDLRRTLLDVVPDLDPGRVTVVYEGAPDDLERTEDPEALRAVCDPLRVQPGRFVLLVSSLNPFKRPERAVEAVARIRAETGGDWPVVLAGRASAEHAARVTQAARRAGAEDLLRIAGTVDRATLGVLYSAARVMIYPSTVETFGLPPLEAMRCGCPVVAADRTSIPEIVGDAGLLADPDDLPALASALRRALEDEDLRTTLVARGRQRVTRFRWDDAARGTLSLLEQAAGSV